MDIIFHPTMCVKMENGSKIINHFIFFELEIGHNDLLKIVQKSFTCLWAGSCRNTGHVGENQENWTSMSITLLKVPMIKLYNDNMLVRDSFVGP